MDAHADLLACRAALREGSYTFFAASLLLPEAVRLPAGALYAFCRQADDAVDQGRDPQAAVSRQRALLARAYQGDPALLADARERALAAVLAHTRMPRALPEALLEGLAWDAQGRRYESIEALHAYAARVAGAVGAMMAVLMGARTPGALARACELGVAMQLSNIARDVGEDARNGRLYLPLAWMREAGLEPEAWLARPVFDARLASVVARLLAQAEQLYAGAGAGVAQLPLACRPGINAARLVYAAIGHQVARQGHDSVSRRAVVPRWRKAGLLAWSFLAMWPAQPAQPAPCLEAVRFLVAAGALPGPVAAPAWAWWQLGRRLDARAAWVIELFDRLERRQGAPATVAGAMPR